ncbi:MAG: hypothetical protein Kow0020_12390 [Wenzhouxiangellaceae bacterium]
MMLSAAVTLPALAVESQFREVPIEAMGTHWQLGVETRPGSPAPAVNPAPAQSRVVLRGSDGINISFPTPAEWASNIRAQCDFGSPALTVPVACQQIGSILFERGRSLITKIGLKNIVASAIDPLGVFSKSDSLKKRIALGTGLMITGSIVTGTCPPIPVEEGWSVLSSSERLQRAEALGYLPPPIPFLETDVDDPSDPDSCIATRPISIDQDDGYISDFGTFMGREFAYVYPFGTYPSVAGQLRNAAPGVRDCLEAVLDAVDISGDLGFNFSFDLDLSFSLGYLPSLNLDFFLEGLFDLIIDAIGLVDFELVALQDFNGWKTDYRQDHPGMCTDTECQFEHGPNEIVFDADVNPASWGRLLPNLYFFQGMFVREYFLPEATALPLEVTLEALEPGGTRVDLYPPRSFVGNPPADRNYTFDRSWLGVVDNCDPSPKIEMHVDNFLPLGVYDIPVTVTDRVGNVLETSVTLRVEDTLPPDLLPPKPVGILVPDGTTDIGFDDPGIGCADSLGCEGSPPAVKIYPPAYFDFASLLPDIGCLLDNSLGVDECIGGRLPVNEQTTVRWDLADPSGNLSTAEQPVFVREESRNQSPVVEDQSFVIPAGVSVELPLGGSDADYDPLLFALSDAGDHGTVSGNPVAIWQNRFSATGLLTNADDAAQLSIRAENGSADGLFVASAAEQRIYLFKYSPAPSSLVNRYDLADLDWQGGIGITPDAITFLDGDAIERSSGNLSQALRNDRLWIGDWTQRKVFIFRDASLSGLWARSALDLPPELEEPVAMTSSRPGGGLTYLYIVDGYDGEVFRFTFGEATGGLTAPPLQATEVSTYGGIDTEFIDTEYDSDDELWLANASASRQMVRVRWRSDQTAELLEGPVSLGDFFDDPDDTGPALPPVQRPVDLIFTGTDNPTWFDLAEFKLVSKTLSNLGNGSFSPRTDRLPNIVEVLSMEEVFIDGTPWLLVLIEDEGQSQFLARFDLQGRLDAVINLFNDSQSPAPLPSAGTTWNDFSLGDQGQMYLLDSGDSSTVGTVSVVTDWASGVEVYDLTQVSNLFIAPLYTPARRISDAPASGASADDHLFVLIDSNTILRHNLNTSANSEILDSGNELGDLEWGNGRLFVSNISSNRIEVYDLDGALLATLGAPDAEFDGLDFNGDTGYGRLYFDASANQLWVSDFPVQYPGTVQERMPRLVSMTPDGVITNELKPEGEPGEFFSFLEPGDFARINAIAAGADDRLYVGESTPLRRLHVFDKQSFVEVECSNGNDGQVCNLVPYTPELGYIGLDELVYFATDPFGAASGEGRVSLTIIDDTEAPTISCPAPVTVEGNSTNGFTARLDDPAAEPIEAMRNFLNGVQADDNTDLPPLVIGDNLPAEFPLGTTVVEYTATDGAANVGSCTSSVTVVDTQPPRFGELPELRFEATGPTTDLIAAGLVPPAVVDNTSVVSVIPVTATGLPVGRHIVTWRATDLAGNQSDADQTIDVVDTTPPVFDPVANIDQFSNDRATPISYPVPNATDIVTTDLNVVCKPSVGTLVSQGEQNVRCIATDEANNQSAVSFTVAVFGDPDHFGSNVVYSDAVNGGQTSVQLLNRKPDTRVYDAPEEAQGLIIARMGTTRSVRGEVPMQIVACNGDLIVGALLVEELQFDDITEVFGQRALVSCDASNQTLEFGSVIGNITGQWFIPVPPVGKSVRITVHSAQIVQRDGTQLIAPESNVGDVTVIYQNTPFSVPPGGTLDLADLIFFDQFETP